MGEAKRRGTFEERRAKALAKAPPPMPARVLTSSAQQVHDNLLLAALLRARTSRRAVLGYPVPRR